MLTATAEVIGAVANVAASGDVSPSTLTMIGGVVLSHITKPLAEKIPAVLGSIKPLIIGAAHIAVAAGVKSATTGTPFTANLGTGLVAAGSAALYHLVALKPNGLLAGLLAGFGKKA